MGGISDAAHCDFVKFQVANRSGEIALAKESFGLEIGDGRVVLVNRADYDALGCCSCRACKRRLPAEVGVIANFAPIDRDEYNRRLLAE